MTPALAKLLQVFGAACGRDFRVWRWSSGRPFRTMVDVTTLVKIYLLLVRMQEPARRVWSMGIGCSRGKMSPTPPQDLSLTALVWSRLNDGPPPFMILRTISCMSIPGRGPQRAWRLLIAIAERAGARLTGSFAEKVEPHDSGAVATRPSFCLA